MEVGHCRVGRREPLRVESGEVEGGEWAGRCEPRELVDISDNLALDK